MPRVTFKLDYPQAESVFIQEVLTIGILRLIPCVGPRKDTGALPSLFLTDDMNTAILWMGNGILTLLLLALSMNTVQKIR